MPVRAAGLVLAAGAGTRYGRPKATVRDEDGRSWLVAAVTALGDGGCRPVIVVLGAEQEQAREILGDTDARVVVAEDWADGLSASLRRGLSALAEEPTDVDRAVVTLVDLPDVGAEAVARLAGLAGGPGVLLRATYDGVPGHPVVLGRDHWADVIATASGDHGAGAYLALHQARPIECADLASGADVDSPGI